MIALPAGRVDPIRPLEYAGQQLWDSVFSNGELWISSRTDIHLLQMTAEQLDRRETLRDALVEEPTENAVLMRLGELEKSIASNLGLLGFTPSDRTRLGLAEVKAQSKLEQLMERKANRVVATAMVTPVPQFDLDSGDGDTVIEFAEAFGIITKDSVAGPAGEPLVMRDWQKQLIRHVFAGDGNGYRNRASLILVPRKNGKSALGSVFALYSLILGAKGAEVYSVAATKEQARIVFADAKRMVEASPELSAITKVYRDAIELPKSGSVYRVLAAEAYSAEGLNPSATIFDEVHAQPNRELWDVMSLAMGSRGRQSTLIGITTAGTRADATGNDSIAYQLYNYGKKIATKEIDDDSFFMACWEAPPEADHRRPETWALANPGYDDICSAEDFVSAVRRTPEAEFKNQTN